MSLTVGPFTEIGAFRRSPVNWTSSLRVYGFVPIRRLVFLVCAGWDLSDSEDEKGRVPVGNAAFLAEP